MYEIYCKLRDEKGCRDADVAKGTGITKSTFSDWKSGRSTPKNDKLQKIADYFGVSLEYLMTGKSSIDPQEAELTAKDKREIGRELDKIMNEIENGEDGPLYYNGNVIDNESLDLLRKALEIGLTQLKRENKVKYNPYKNKKK